MDFLKGVSQAMSTAAKNLTAEDFSRAGAALVKAKAAARERLQEATASAIKPIIHKLEKYLPLTPEEQDLIRLWIVGDAEAFVKMENDYQAWLAEFQRLSRLVADKAGEQESLPELLAVHGALQDAARLSGDLQFFLEEEARLARFEKAINHLDKSDAELLARILKEKLASPDM